MSRFADISYLTWFIGICGSLVIQACAPQIPTGSAAVEIVFQNNQNRTTRGVLSGLAETVRITVKEGNNTLVQQAFEYETTNQSGQYEGVVSNIPTGTGREFRAEVLSAGEVFYAGTTTNVQISADSTPTVAITLSPVYTQDIYPPAQISDLRASINGSSIILAWTATGNDGRVGTADHYELRWSKDSINATNFALATTLPGVPTPNLAGTPQSTVVTDLTEIGTYYFAIQVFDDAGNSSEVSAETSATVGSQDLMGPARIIDLSIVAIGEDSLTLEWTAPGDDGTNGVVSQYDVRYSPSAIDDDNFDTVDSFVWPAAQEIVTAGAKQSLVITDLTMGQTHYIAIKAADEVPNWSNLSNVTEARPFDQTPPNQIRLSVGEVTADSVTLTFKAPSDPPTAGIVDYYEVFYSQGVIDQTNFDTATRWEPAPTPETPGTSQSVTINNLEQRSYTMAMVSYDSENNRSDLSTVVEVIPGQEDQTAPARVTQINIVAVHETSVILSWTAPGDDGDQGSVFDYDIRYSTSDIVDQNSFDTATSFAWPAEVSLVPSGELQQVEVTGLQTDQLVYFALVATDDNANTSEISVSVSATPIN